MKFLTLHTAVLTLAAFVDAMVSVNAVTSNSLTARRHTSLSLLELFRRHPHPMSEHEVGPMLKSAESMLMSLATGHNSAPLADLVAQIRPFITQMQDSINAAHTSVQQTLTDLGSDIAGCNTIKTTGDAEASSLETAKTSHSNDHKSCRTRQKAAGGQLNDCQQTLDALEGSKTSSCQLYEDAKQTPGCGGIPATSGETWESYTERAADYFAQERDDFKNKKAVCLNDTAKLEDKKKECSGPDPQLQKVFDDTKQECSDKQIQLESTTCSYVSKVNSTCNDFATCASALADSFDGQKSSVETLEHQRKVEWNTTERLLCILDVYGASGDVDTTKVQNCFHMADNTSHLNLVYPTIPRPSPCGAILPHPCGADYIQAEYGSLDVPAGNCTPCSWAKQPAGSSRARYWRLTVTAGGTYGTGPDVDGHYCFGGYGPYGFAIYDDSSNRILPSAVECTECRGSYGDSALLGSFTNGQHWCVWSPHNDGRSVLTITFAQEVSPAEYKFDCGGSSNCATSWTIEQSMDGTSWTEIETQTNRPPNNPQEYALAIPQPTAAPPPASCSRQARYWKLIVREGGTYGTGPTVDGHYCFGGYGPYGFAIYDGSSNRILPSAVECTECRGSYGDSALLGSFTNGEHWCVWSPHNNGRSVLTITFAQDVTPVEYKFDCGGASNCATSWTIEQSMDGTSWTEVEMQTNRPPNNPQEYVLQHCPVTNQGLVTDKTKIKLQNQQGSVLAPEWIMKKCYATQPDTNWKPPAPWTDSASLPATADEVIYTCDVVALWIVGVDKVQDCAHGGCSQQPYPPPNGHWGTPYRPQKEGKPCGDPIHVGDAIYFDRLMNDAWTGSHFLTQSGDDLSGGSVKTIFNVQGQAPANAWNQSALWSEDFENGQTGWQGQSTSAFHSGPECYGGSGSCWKFNQCTAAGDLFAVGYTIPSACQGACTLTYWYKGMVLAGTDLDGHKGGGHHWWPHSTSDIPPSSDWVERTITGVSGGHHLMLETYAGNNCVSYLDNIIIQQDS